MHTPLATLVHQQAAADRRHRYLSEATRSRRLRRAAAPDPTRTADLGPSVLPVRSPAAAVRVGDTTDEPLAA